jgi:hypothetical protein
MNILGARNWSALSQADSATGKRTQLPTVRVLPPRQQALRHAYKEGLIAIEEFEMGMNLSNMPETADSEGEDKDLTLDLPN